MDSSSQQKTQDDVDVMEVPEIHGDLLVELLDASLAAEDAGSQQLGSVADVVDGDVYCWIDSHQENYDIHAHQDCEDCCGLDGGILPDFDEYGGSRRRLRSPSAPYVVFDHGDTLEWAETADADGAMDPFTSECTGGWYMDGLVMAMAMEWEEQDDGTSGGFPFEPCYGGEAGAAEQVYASPLWE